ncbi:hypothetical protein ACWEFL_21735 [Streptomyces sp. NPDC004838]
MTTNSQTPQTPQNSTNPTNSTNPMSPTNSTDPRNDLPDPAGPEPFLTVHTALVLLIAVVIGIVVGGLTLLSGTPAAGAVLAGLVGSGGSVPVLRSLIR